MFSKVLLKGWGLCFRYLGTDPQKPRSSPTELERFISTSVPPFGRRKKPTKTFCWPNSFPDVDLTRKKRWMPCEYIGTEWCGRRGVWETQIRPERFWKVELSELCNWEARFWAPRFWWSWCFFAEKIRRKHQPKPKRANVAGFGVFLVQAVNLVGVL